MGLPQVAAGPAGLGTPASLPSLRHPPGSGPLGCPWEG